MKIKVLLADDNQLFRELLAARFAQNTEIEIVAEVDSSHELLEKVRHTKPDIVLMEVQLSRVSGAEMALAIYNEQPETKVIALTSNNEKNYIKYMLEAKAWGYLLKNCSFDQLQESIKQVHSGKKQLNSDIQGILIDDYLDQFTKKTDFLTSREMEILKMLADGKSIREISDILFISIKTTGTHKQKIFDKLQFENLAQLIRYSMKNGIIS